jgi:O-antigen/teichoic acid export membrane protein
MFKIIFLKCISYFSEGHSRSILAKKNITSTFFVKSCNFLLGMLLVPMTLNYISPLEYGIWLTLSSIINWFSFFDIGLGNGLKNILAETNALGHNNKSQIYISTSYAILTFISLFIFLIFIFVNPIIDWTIFLNTTNINEETLNQYVLILIIFFCISFIIQPINTILTATHNTAKLSIIGLIGSFFSYIFVYFLSVFTEASLLKLIIILAGIPILVQIIATLFFFKTNLEKFSPKIKFVNFKYAKQLLNVGSIFFIIQIGALLIFK